MEPLTLSAFVVSVLSILAVFIKTIRKCKCDKSGLEIERTDVNGVEEQHRFIIELVKSLKNNFTPRKKSTQATEESQEAQPDLEANSVSNATQKLSHQSMSQPISMPQQVHLTNITQNTRPPKRNDSDDDISTLDIKSDTTTKDIAEHLDMIPRTKDIKIVSMSDIIHQVRQQQSMKTNKDRESYRHSTSRQKDLSTMEPSGHNTPRFTPFIIKRDK